MCGLFGMVRATGADVDRASKFLLRLGLWAEDRGIDGAGLALGLPGEPPAQAATGGDARAAAVPG
jgi:hypothetical protein